MYLLEGVIQPYPWGGYEYIPRLLGRPTGEGRPAAEYWLGAHAGGPSTLRLSPTATTTLPNFIRSNSRRYLGPAVAATFSDLPYLLKVLDVCGMLSIQVHPTREGAREGFARENAMGIPLDAPHRNYRDENHKPEVMVALSEFWLLHGFRQDIQGSFSMVPEFAGLCPVYEKGGLEALYRHVMECPPETVDAYLEPLARRLVPLYGQGLLEKSGADFWAARVLAASAHGFQGLDRGVFSIYLFNIVHLQAGQAIFQGAGVPHAYLEGQNVELMSNSDNVLRAGLTPKHIDIPELMKHTVFRPVVPDVMNGLSDQALTRYPCPVADFSIDHLSLAEGEVYVPSVSGPEIWLQCQGTVQWEGLRPLQTRMGQAVFLSPGEPCQLRARQAASLFRAYVP